MSTESIHCLVLNALHYADDIFTSAKAFNLLKTAVSQALMLSIDKT